jgi:electron-transferring-flavoprotein dehydrogenase
MGWPLPPDVFGGSFMYPLEKNLISLGLVMGLDYKNASLDSHFLMQQMKTHPLFQSFLKNGQVVEWGAKTIPEGGYYSIPKRLSGDGLLLIGDSAGLVDVPSLKGIHYAISSGIRAARAILESLKKKNFSAEILSDFDNSVKSSFIAKDLWRHRNMRLGFKDGLRKGAAKAAIMHITNGKWPGKRISIQADNEVMRSFDRPWKFQPDGKLTFKKADAVYRSGNATRDSIPSHLLTAENINPDVAEFYAKICPAGVYEVVDGKLRVNSPNCIDCKATDILAGRWTPREAGSGPKYKRM